MQNLRLLPEEKGYMSFRNHKRRGGGNSFSFLERDATKDYCGKKMKSLKYLEDINFKLKDW